MRRRAGFASARPAAGALERGSGASAGRHRRAGARRRRVGDRAFQHLLVRRDRVGELLHQLAELVDLGGERLGRGAVRSMRGGDLALHRDDAAVELRDLAADVGGAARQIRDLAADVVAVALAAGDRIDHHQRGQHRDGDARSPPCR